VPPRRLFAAKAVAVALGVGGVGGAPASKRRQSRPRARRRAGAGGAPGRRYSSALTWSHMGRAAARRLTVGGYSYDEIAEQLDASYSTVNRQLVRARGAIRAARDGA
jgi:sigma-70-like protein